MTLTKLIERFQTLKVVVVGDVMLDHYVFGETTRISPEAPVPIVHVTKESHAPGGAANVAMNARALGAEVSLVGYSRDDAWGKKLQHILGKAGVRTHHRIPNDGKTMVKTRVMSGSHQICRIDDEDPKYCYERDLAKHHPAIRLEVAKAHACIVSDYAKGLVTDGLLNSIRLEARQSSTFTSFDPCSRSRVNCLGFDLLTPNHDEAIDLCGLTKWTFEADPQKLFPILHNRFQAANLAITMGEHGIMLGHEGRVCETVPATEQKIFDVSGAGDTVIATMTLAMAVGAPLREAAILANLAAGCVVRQIGTCPVTIDDLRDELAQSKWAEHEF